MRHPLRTALATSVLALLPAVASAAAEELSYQVVDYYSGFELRRYPRHLVAETEATGPFEQVSKEAFQVLSSYTSGNNRRADAAGMTAPAEQESEKKQGEKIGRTAPATQIPTGTGGQSKYIFALAMPAKYTLETLPQPLDPRVTIREVPERLVAARRFSDKWSEASCRRNETALLTGVATAGLKPVGTPFYARYSSPLGMWFMRRNEAMVEVVRAESDASR